MIWEVSKPGEATNCAQRRRAMESTSADLSRKYFRPSFEVEKSRWSRADSASYCSRNSLLSGDCVGMPAFLLSYQESRPLEWHDPGRKTSSYMEVSQSYPSSPCW